MKKLALLLAAFGTAVSCLAGQTSTLISQRSKAGDSVTPGKWHAGFKKCKDYAVKNDVPLIAVWSNGDSCGHCVAFESSVNSSYFKSWMKTSGCVFYFIYSGDGGDGAVGSSVFHWIRNNKNTAYPFVRIYWPKGKVDIATVGDTIDGNKDGTTGGKKAVAYFKDKLKKFSAVTVDGNLPYNIEYDANLPEDYDDYKGANDITQVEPVQTVYSNVVTVANGFALENYAFTGWSMTTNGAVKYADGASVSKLTSTSNATVKLYAKWVHSPVAINFNANFEPVSEEDVTEMEPLSAKYDETVTLENGFVRKDFAFAGWSKTPDGAVAYKDKAAVKNLTTDAEITLYAKWTRITYRVYYTGMSYTISTGLKGYAAKTTFPGMKWTSSTGKWSGKPTKANATDPVWGVGLKVKFVKGKSTVYRNFVVVKDALSLAGAETKTLEVTTSDDDLEYSAVAISGDLQKGSVSVTGLPAGMSYSVATGLISGRPTTAGTYTVVVAGTSNQGQKLSTSYKFVVTEGNQLVLNGMVHVDKMFMNAGEEKEIDVLFLDKEDKAYDIASVEVSGVEGLAWDAEKGALVGTVAAGTYEMSVTIKSSDEVPAELTQKIKLVAVPLD